MQKYSLLRCLFLLRVAETTGAVESMLRARYLQHLPSPFLVMFVMWRFLLTLLKVTKPKHREAKHLSQSQSRSQPSWERDFQSHPPPSKGLQQHILLSCSIWGIHMQSPGSRLPGRSSGRSRPRQTVASIRYTSLPARSHGREDTRVASE